MGYLRQKLLSHVSPNSAYPSAQRSPGSTTTATTTASPRARARIASHHRPAGTRKSIRSSHLRADSTLSADQTAMDVQTRPSVPVKWSFYNLKQSIDDPYKSFNVEALDSISSRIETEDAKNAAADEAELKASLADSEELAKQLHHARANSADIAGNAANTNSATNVNDRPHQPSFSKSTMRKSIAPITEWIAFNPSDNARLNDAYANHSSEPIAVGHDRSSFEVFNFRRLRPIYWSIPYSTKVVSTHWVFSDTSTPINPDWDAAISPHFVNFIDNLATYEEVLVKAQTSDAAVMRVIRQRLESTQAMRPMPVDSSFSPRNSCVYMFKADSSYVCTRQAASALSNGTTPRGVIAVLRPFEFTDYKRFVGSPDRPSDDVNYEPLPVNNLILVFHGVGQKSSSSYTRVNFVYAIDKLRVEVSKASETPEVYTHFPPDEEMKNSQSGDKVDVSEDSTDYNVAAHRVRNLVLAVNWRSAFDSEHIPDLSDITVPALQSIRQSFSDAMLDIPSYMSENRRPAMLAAAASEANRIYNLVSKHHASFAQHGRTHVVGHSLGSLITADLLTHQPTTLNETNVADAPFKFQTHNYFCTGSMLGVFMSLKGERLISRKEYERIHGEDNTSRPRPLGCFAVDNIYNIIHQLDLSSFLSNPTVKGADHASSKHLVGKDNMCLEADESPSAHVPASSSSLLSSFTSHAPGTSSLSTTASVAASSSAVAMASASLASSETSTSPPSVLVTQSSTANSSAQTSPESSPNSPRSPSHSPKQTPSPSASSSSISTLGKFFSSPFSRFIGNDGDDPSLEPILNQSATSHSAEDANTEPKEVPPEVVDLESRFKTSNENGQLDWKIPQPSSYIPSHYFKMFTAHFDYWSNKDIARFIAIECGRRPGAEHTIPEHRVKWTYK